MQSRISLRTASLLVRLVVKGVLMFDDATGYIGERGVDGAVVCFCCAG